MKLETAFTYLHGKTIEQAIEINRLRNINNILCRENDQIKEKYDQHKVQLEFENKNMESEIKKHLSRIDMLLNENKVLRKQAIEAGESCRKCGCDEFLCGHNKKD